MKPPSRESFNSDSPFGVRVALATSTESQTIFLAEAQWLGVNFTLRYRVDAAEDDRRRRIGLGSVNEISVLSAALALPRESIDAIRPGPGTTSAEVATSGLVDAVEDTDGCLWGRLCGRHALNPTEAAIPARSVRAGLSLAYRLGGYAPRSIVVPKLSRRDASFLTEASFYGVGVRVGSTVADSHVEIPAVAQPAARLSAEWWEFSEAMYSRHLASVSDHRGV